MEQFNTPVGLLDTFFGLYGKLITEDRLRDMEIVMPSICYLCKQSGENHEHLFWGCKVVRGIWRKPPGLLGEAPSSLPHIGAAF